MKLTRDERNAIGRIFERRIAVWLEETRNMQVWIAAGYSPADILIRNPEKQTITGIDVKRRFEELDRLKATWPGHLLKRDQLEKLIAWGEDTGLNVGLIVGFDCGTILTSSKLNAWEPTESRNPYEPGKECVSLPWGCFQTLYVGEPI